MSPQPILTAEAMRACDTHTIEVCGVPSQVLMERAARAAVTYLLTHPALFPVGRVVLLCGSGNNGGDGFAAARFLTDGSMGTTREAVVIYTGRGMSDGNTPTAQSDDSAQGGGFRPDCDHMSTECARQYRLAVEAGVPVQPPAALPEALRHATAVVDAVFGIGLDRPITGATAELLRAVAATELPVLAMDIPSGIHADTGAVMGVALPARATVTMQARKAGLVLFPGADHSGEVAVCDIGIDLSLVAHILPAPAILADRTLLRTACPPRARRTHKGTYGRTVLLCGSPGMSGAAVLSTRAALRSGAGLAEVVTPEVNRTILQLAIPEAIVTAYDPAEPSRTVREAIRRADSVVLGCGLGLSPSAVSALGAALAALPTDGHIPTVLDADALNLLADDPTLWETAALAAPRGQVVITPHPAEMARLSGLSVPAVLADLPGTARAFARTHGVVVVLKDAHTVIAAPNGTTYLSTAGNAGMAKGGSGDALAGIIGALLAQNRARLATGNTLVEVVAAAVYLHGTAGDHAAAVWGEYGLLASDLIEHIPPVLKDI